MSRPFGAKIAKAIGACLADPYSHHDLHGMGNCWYVQQAMRKEVLEAQILILKEVDERAKVFGNTDAALWYTQDVLNEHKDGME